MDFLSLFFFFTVFPLYFLSSIIGNTNSLPGFDFYHSFCLDDCEKSGKALKYLLFVLFLEMFFIY